MKAAFSILFISLGIMFACGAEPPATLTIVHTYEWHEFTLTKDSPVSDDGRYKLKRVRFTGSVELIRDDTDVVIVKPKDRLFAAAKPTETILVVEASASKQSARIRELRITCREVPNKAPEPTPPSVTPRASESVFEMTPRNVNRSDARGAPAGGVAHL